MSSAYASAKLEAGLGRDTRSLETLAGKADRAGSEDARKAAEQFEQLMLFELLKTMRATIPKSEDGAEGFASGTFDQMMDQTLSEAMAGRLGLAPLLEQQLGTGAEPAPRTEFAPLQRPSVAAAEPSHVTPRTAGSEFAAPVAGRRSSDYGWRTHPVSGERRFHAGIDIAAPEGREIRAVQAGTVTFAGRNGGYGNFVELRHDDGSVTRYAHASRVHVRVGDRVEAGETVADVGSTGHSTGPHLHFEVRKDGRPVDPDVYLRELQASPTSAPAARPRAGVTNFSLARFVKAYDGKAKETDA